MEEQCNTNKCFRGGGWLSLIQGKELVQGENHRNVKPDHR